MNKRGNTLLGVMLIAFGLLFLVTKSLFKFEFFKFGVGDLWPLFVLTPGVIFEWIYFSTKSKPGLLVPGGILTTIGLLFFFEIATGWSLSSYTWPVYIISVAVGLFQLYIFGKRNIGVLVAAFIPATLAVLLEINMLYNWAINEINISLILSIVFILLGVLIIFGRKEQKESY